MRQCGVTFVFRHIPPLLLCFPYPRRGRSKSVTHVPTDRAARRGTRRCRFRGPPSRRHVEQRTGEGRTFMTLCGSAAAVAIPGGGFFVRTSLFILGAW